LTLSGWSVILLIGLLLSKSLSNELRNAFLDFHWKLSLITVNKTMFLYHTGELFRKFAHLVLYHLGVVSLKNILTKLLEWNKLQIWVFLPLALLINIRLIKVFYITLWAQTDTRFWALIYNLTIESLNWLIRLLNWLMCVVFIKIWINISSKITKLDNGLLNTHFDGVGWIPHIMYDHIQEQLVCLQLIIK
jgi:hypothetical protein